MNFQDSYDDVSTLAHELGHALHSSLAMEYQPYLTSRYVPFLAEIASTANEVLLSEYMVAHAESELERAWYLTELVETIRTTIFRQTLFAEFELRLHEFVEAGEPVTAEKLNAVYGDLIETYYGPGYTMDADDPVEWAYIPHFYYKYYVFTYATGLASGVAIAEKISDRGPGRPRRLSRDAGGRQLETAARAAQGRRGRPHQTRRHRRRSRALRSHADGVGGDSGQGVTAPSAAGPVCCGPCSPRALICVRLRDVSGCVSRHVRRGRSEWWIGRSATTPMATLAACSMSSRRWLSDALPAEP